MISLFPALFLLLPFLLAAPADNWPQFRGPEGTGHATAKGLPGEWSESRNITWKTAIHDRGWSSPVIHGNQIWLTTATKDGRQLFAICLDRKTGRIIRDLKLFEVATPQYAHPFNSYASPTPVIEDGRVFITFGSPGTACIDTKSFRVIWQRTDIECNHFRGAGSSPFIFRNQLLMHYDGSDHQFAIATINGRLEMISLGSRAAYGYDPLTGRELWRVEEHDQFSASTRPVLGFGMIFFPTGFSVGQLFAVKTGGNGDITQSHVAWRHKRSVSNKPSILLIDDLIYMIGDTGILSCLEAKTGTLVWMKRIGGEFSSSPIYADGKIYFIDEAGKSTVIRPGRSFDLVAENMLDEGALASPAAVDGALFIRTRTHLYRIEEKR